MMPPENDRISNDAKWIIGMVVAAVATGIGAAVVVVAVTGPRASRLATELRHHEERVRAANDAVLLELRWLFDGMRDDYRERMHGVEDIERELRAIRQRLESREQPGPGPVPDIEQALSDVERTLSALMHPRSVRARYVTERLDEVLDELQKIRAQLRESGASTTDEPQEQEDGADSTAAQEQKTESAAPSPDDTQTQDSRD